MGLEERLLDHVRGVQLGPEPGIELDPCQEVEVVAVALEAWFGALPLALAFPGHRNLCKLKTCVGTKALADLQDSHKNWHSTWQASFRPFVRTRHRRVDRDGTCPCPARTSPRVGKAATGPAHKAR